MWMVTGGAGYIGAHVVRALQAAHAEVLVVDNLSTGLRRRIPDGVVLAEVDIRDTTAVDAAFARFRPNGVIHLAGRKDVAESARQPLSYYGHNLEGLRSVLRGVIAHRVGTVLFSSSAAVYGATAGACVRESDSPAPINAYGRTKLAGEWLLRDAAASANFGWAALRYFNVAGAAEPALRDTGTANLLPRLLRSAEAGQPAIVHGGQYPTPDGSPIRDYVHVEDVADVHVATAFSLTGGALAGGGEIFNVGRGVGCSVLEMIAAVGRRLGRDLPYEVGPRRAGDPARVVACVDRIADRLGWRARLGLDDIVRSAAGESSLATV
jgi:UDP-glucose 4-epimerase